METIGPSKEKITKRFLEAVECVIRKYEFHTQKDFAASIEVGNHHISNLNIGKSQVNAWMIGSLVEKYPEINPDYILHGHGELLRDAPPRFRTTSDMWEYLETLQEENALLRKQIELLQKLLLEKRPT